MTLKQKIAAILKETGVTIPEKMNETILKNLVFSRKSGTEINVAITTETPHATVSGNTSDATIAGDDAKALKAKKAQKAADDKQAQNIADIKKAIDGINIVPKQGDKTVKEIVAEIKKGKTIADILANLKRILGIDLPEHNNGTDITDIKLTPKSDGTIGVEVITTTKGAKTPTPTPGVTGKLIGKSDKTVKDKLKHDAANAKKAADIKAIESKLKGVDITKGQGTDSIAEVIAKLKKKGASIADIIAAIKAITGGTVDLGAGHPDTKITDINLKPGKKDGEISVEIKTSTTDATPEAGNAHGTLQGNKKAVVADLKKTASANKAQIDNIAAIQALFKGAKLKNQGMRTIDEIVAA